MHINYGRMRLRPSTCYLLLQLADVREGSVVLDPMGGVGTIAIEAKWSELQSDTTAQAEMNCHSNPFKIATGVDLRVLLEPSR